MPGLQVALWHRNTSKHRRTHRGCALNSCDVNKHWKKEKTKKWKTAAQMKMRVRKGTFVNTGIQKMCICCNNEMQGWRSRIWSNWGLFFFLCSGSENYIHMIKKPHHGWILWVGKFPFCKLPHCGTTILHLIISACCFDSSSSVNRIKENSSGLPSLKTHQIHQSTTPKTLLWNVLEVANGTIKKLLSWVNH